MGKRDAKRMPEETVGKTAGAAVGEVAKETVKEAVKESIAKETAGEALKDRAKAQATRAPAAETRRPAVARRKRFSRRTVIIASSIAFLLIVAYVWLQLHFLFGDDLILDFTANQTSFRITNAENAPMSVTLRGENQLFCQAACSLVLENVSTQAIAWQENLTLSPGETRTQDFVLAPGRVGSGQTVYSVTASCHNVWSLLCPTQSPQRRTTILLTVNYGLSRGEQDVKPLAKAAVEGMLVTLQRTDLLLREIDGIISGNQALHTASEQPAIAKAQDGFYKAKLFLESAKDLWSEQSYQPLYDILQSSAVNQTSLDMTLADAQAIRTALDSLASRHDALRDRLDAARSQLSSVLDGWAQLAGDAQARPLMLDAANQSDTAVTEYATGGFPSYDALEGDIAALENGTIALNATLTERAVEAVAEGNALLAAQGSWLCAQNVTCGIVIPGGQDLSSVCDALAGLSNLSIAVFNATLNATVNVTVNASGDATASFVGEYCDGSAPIALNMTTLVPLTLAVPAVSSSVTTTLTEALPQCCVFGQCRACCNTAECANDPSTYPVIFVHGHAFNAGTSPEYSLGGYFSKIQDLLQQDGYLDAGIVTPSSTLDDAAPGEWGVSGRPVTVRVTYYYNYYRNGTDYILVPQKSENIETYSIRLKELIDIVKHHTGKQKVDIVAHSMGGLVVRRYLQLFGEDSVDKVILIATPDYGIVSRTAALCPVFGESKECDDMVAGSVFMSKLNDPAAQPQYVNVTTIAGVGCDVGGKPGDGVVQAQSVALPYAKNYVVNGTCSGLFGTDMHSDLLDPDKYPQVYGIIKSALQAK